MDDFSRPLLIQSSLSRPEYHTLSQENAIIDKLIKPLLNLVLYYFDVATDIVTVIIMLRVSNTLAGMILGLLLFRLAAESILEFIKRRRAGFYRNALSSIAIMLEIQAALLFITEDHDHNSQVEDAQHQKTDTAPTNHLFNRSQWGDSTRDLSAASPFTETSFNVSKSEILNTKSASLNDSSSSANATKIVTPREDHELYEVVLEAGPTLVVQLSLLLYFQYVPSGFDALSFNLLSALISLLSLSVKFSKFVLKERPANGSPRSIFKIANVFLFAATDVASHSFAMSIFAYELSLHITNLVGSQRSDLALVIGILCALTSMYLIKYYTLHVHNRGYPEDSTSMRPLDRFSFTFTSISIENSASCSFFGRSVVSAIVCIAISSWVLSSVTISVVSVFGMISAATSILKLVFLSFIPYNNYISENAAISAYLPVNFDVPQKHESHSTNRKYFLRGLLAFTTIIAAVIYIQWSVTKTPGTNLLAGTLRCDSKAHSLIVPILKITEIDALLINDDCQIDQFHYVSRVSSYIIMADTKHQMQLELPELRFVGQSLSVISNIDLESIVLASLTFVGSDFSINFQPSLQFVDLSTLVFVEGNFQISGNSNLVYFGILFLSFVQGNIQIEANQALSIFSAPNLKTVGADLNVNTNSATTDIYRQGSSQNYTTGLLRIEIPLLTNVFGNLLIASNAFLKFIDIDSLSFVGGNLVVNDNYYLDVLTPSTLLAIGGYMSISNNSILVNVDMDALQYISGNMGTSNNDVLSSINCASLISIGGLFSVQDNPYLLTQSFPSLSNINGSVIIQNTGLTYFEITFLNQIKGSFFVSSNLVLTLVSAPGLRIVGGDFIISSNNQLAGFNIQSLTSVLGSFEIPNNQQLRSLQTTLLQQVYGSLNVSNNPQLSNDVKLGVLGPDSLSLLNLVFVGGKLEISSCLILTYMSFAVLTSSSGIVISDNFAIGSILFPILSVCNAGFLISNNINLRNIEFGPLQNITGQFQILGQLSLAQTINISTLQVVTGDLIISYNPQLLAISFSTLTYLPGKLFIAGNFELTSVSLPSLSILRFQMLEGFMIANNINLQQLFMPNLSECRTSININSNQLTSLELPLLTIVKAYFWLVEPSVSLISIPSIVYVGSDLKFISNATDYVANNLTFVGGSLYITGGMSMLSFSSLSYTQQVYITDITASTVSFPKLEILAIQIEVSNCNQLQSIEAPNVTNTAVRIFDNPALLSIDLSSLALAYNVSFENNGLLTFISLPCLSSIVPSAIVSSPQLSISFNPSLTLIDFSGLISLNVSAITICANSPLLVVPPNITSLKQGQDICFIAQGDHPCPTQPSLCT